MTRRGFFVVLEGSEGSGKSTLLAGLTQCMRAGGVDPVVVREPGGTRAAEIARQALLDPEHPVGPISELFLYLAARADLVQTIIGPALTAGRVVLSDRFALSTEAYQMAGRGLDPVLVRTTNSAAAQGVSPDLTLILDLAPELGQARQVSGGKAQDRLDRESIEFHRRVQEYYLAVRGSGVRHLDARLPPDQLLQAAWAEVRNAAPETFQAAVG
ncbi:MAG TPA: dTMP kinase [Gemmatimonadales bacterium]|nr:dTMP kinase [Gemmatimonadales bacterium]